MSLTDRLTSWALVVAVMVMCALLGFLLGVRMYQTPEVLVPHPAQVVQSITEDDPEWNCLTMGNRVCGPQWTDVETATVDDGSLLVDVLSEGERSDWTGCLINDTTIICPDGYRETTQ